MAKLKEYSSLSEKAKFFDQTNVNSKKDFDKIFEDYYQTKQEANFIFRGVSEAKYKLYNSAQRSWLNLELGSTDAEYKRFIETVIKNGKNWQNKLLTKFFNAFGQPALDLSVLSFLQHYKAPTPLLDWTYSLENASFFAVEKYTNPNTDVDIENYFSIYQIDIAKNNVKNLISIVEENQIKPLEQVNKNKKATLKYINKEFFPLLNYDSIEQHKVVYIPGYKVDGFAFTLKSAPLFNLVFNQQNLNIINQKGLFILSSSPNEPLENLFQNIARGLMQAMPQIKCYNIHKSLYEYVIFRLHHDKKGRKRKIPIDKKFIYPQEEMIASKAFQHFLNFDYL